MSKKDNQLIKNSFEPNLEINNSNRVNDVVKGFGGKGIKKNVINNTNITINDIKNDPEFFKEILENLKKENEILKQQLKIFENFYYYPIYFYNINDFFKKYPTAKKIEYKLLITNPDMINKYKKNNIQIILGKKIKNEIFPKFIFCFDKEINYIKMTKYR